MSEIIIREITHPRFRKKETRTLEKSFVDTYLTDEADKNLLNLLKLKLGLKIPLYLFVEFFAYNSVGWATTYDFAELKTPDYETPSIWLSKDLDQIKESGSGQKVGEVGKALLETVNLMAKSSSEILQSSEVQPINTLAVNSLCLMKEFNLCISLGGLVFLHKNNEQLSHSLKSLISQILEAFESYCKSNKKIQLVY